MSLRIFVPSAASLLTDHRAHGEGLIASNLLTGLAARGHQVVACAREVDLRREPAFDVVEIGRRTRLESVEPFAQTRAVQAEYDRRGGDAAFDIAHWIFPPDFDELAFRPARSIPFVYGPHALDWSVGGRAVRAGDLIRAAARPVLRRRARRALDDARVLLFSVPEAIPQLPVSAGTRARILPFGVDAARFGPSALPATPTVLFAGKLEPLKRADTLIDAFALLRNRDARLVIAGTGSEHEALVAHARDAGIEHRVAWLGDVAHDEMPQAVASSSLVCSTSIGEPYGMSLLEGMAGGRAVIASDSGGPRFLVDRNGGALVWPPTAENFAAALDELLPDTDRLAELGQWNRERVERELDWPRVLDRLEEIYAEAMTLETAR